MILTRGRAGTSLWIVDAIPRWRLWRPEEVLRHDSRGDGVGPARPVVGLPRLTRAADLARTGLSSWAAGGTPREKLPHPQVPLHDGWGIRSGARGYDCGRPAGHGGGSLLAQDQAG